MEHDKMFRNTIHTYPVDITERGPVEWEMYKTDDGHSVVTGCDHIEISIKIPGMTIRYVNDEKEKYNKAIEFLKERVCSQIDDYFSARKKLNIMGSELKKVPYSQNIEEIENATHEQLAIWYRFGNRQSHMEHLATLQTEEEANEYIGFLNSMNDLLRKRLYELGGIPEDMSNKIGYE